MSSDTKRTATRGPRCAARRATLAAFGLAAGLAALGCARGPDELLVAYSGNSQAYIEPCG